jgi:ribonuclease-3
MFKFLYKSYKTIHSIHITTQIKLFSMSVSTNYNNNTNTSNNVIYDKKRILEIVNSIKNTDNFKLAFTHSSCRNSNKENDCYERLEFLGDSLIEYYTTHLLFKCYPKQSEGDLTKLRSLIVERKNLSKISKQIGLDELLILGVNIEKSTKILADIFESFIAALYLEKGEDILNII